MNTDLNENRIISFLEGDLNLLEQKTLLAEIEESDALKSLFNHYSEMYALMDGDMYEFPSTDLQQKFDNYITKLEGVNNKTQDQSKIKSLFGYKNILGIAATFLLLFTLWSNMSDRSNLSKQNNLLASSAHHNSATERIKTIRVNYNDNTESNNEEMLHMLCKVLKEDQSSNVRLAAAETLGKYVENERVRIGLIRALEKEEDGFVKLAIIHALGNNLNDKVKETFENLVQDETQEKFVKDEAYMKLIQY